MHPLLQLHLFETRPVGEHAYSAYVHTASSYSLRKDRDTFVGWYAEREYGPPMLLLFIAWANAELARRVNNFDMNLGAERF